MKIKNKKGKNWFLFILLLILLIGLLVLNIFSSKYKIDNNSIKIIILLFILLYVPDISKLISRISKFKIGENEILLTDGIEKLSDEISNSTSNYKIPSEIIPVDVMNRINDSMNNPRSALISIAIEIEKRIQDLIDENGLKRNPGIFSPRMMLGKLVDEGLVSSKTLDLFKEFWKIRNLASHAYQFDIDNQDLYELADNGVKLLSFLYLES